MQPQPPLRPGWFQESARRLSTWHRLIALALILAFFAQAAATIPRLSLTADEPVYMGAGYAFLLSGDLRMATSAQHPPLMQELVSFLLLLQPGPRLEGLNGWGTAEMVLYAPAFVAWYGDALPAATFCARIPVLWIALMLAAFLFRWATDWFGPWGGLVALTLFAFDPNVLAHATLATTDIGFATFGFIALFAAVRLIRRSSWGYLALAGLALGASMSAKSSGFFAVLAVAALLPLAALVRDGPCARSVLLALLQLLLLVALGLVVLWATYGFEVRCVGDGGVPIPLATHWEVWREMRAHLTTGHTAFLMGQIRDTGWLTYYPWAFFLKTPPTTSVLMVGGLVLALAAGPRGLRAFLPLWVYTGGYAVATLLSVVSTGYRFLLPVLPFGFILVAGLFRDGTPWTRSPLLRWGGWAALLLIGAIISAGLFPHYLTYFNLFAGGPLGGYRYLVDSNLDWGQSFKALAAYLDEQEIGQVKLSYYTYADPVLYDIHYTPVPPSPGASPVLSARFNPALGTYVLGATTLQGLMLVDPDTYDWFRHREPVARPGNALFVYRVTPSRKQPEWLAQCTNPVAPLSLEAAQEGFGLEGLRMVTFDCTSAWIYLDDEAPGWYAFFRDTARSNDPFIQAHLSNSRLSYEQRRAGALPPFALYEHQARPSLSHLTAPKAPIRVGALTFLGHTTDPEQAARPGREIEVTTWWRVESVPARPLSILLHLVGPGGMPVLTGDGLGVPVEGWQVGDLIVQRHLLAVPMGAPAGKYTLATGAYWLDVEGTERWPVYVNGQLAGDRLELRDLAVGSVGR